MAAQDPGPDQLHRLVKVMERLRRECPWDAEQTHRSLATYLVEETGEVLDAIETTVYDAVIIDLHMPGVSGIDVIRQSRVMHAGRQQIPFIVLSADVTARTIAAPAPQSARRPGCEGFAPPKVARALTVRLPPPGSRLTCQNRAPAVCRCVTPGRRMRRRLPTISSPA